MPSSLNNFVSSTEFLWLQVVLAIWLYVRWIPLLRLPWILLRRCFKWEPIYSRAKFMSCYLDVSYDITPLAGEPSTYGNPAVLVADQTGICSTRYTRSANGYAVICVCGKQEKTYLVDRAVVRDFSQAVNLINEGYVMCTAMRSLIPGVYLCSHTDAFTFLEVVCASGYFCFCQKEVSMIIDREPLVMDTPTYAKIFDTLPFVAQAKGYQMLSAIFSAVALLGSFFTPLPWIVLNLVIRVSKNGFQWIMGLSNLTNRILLVISTILPQLRPLNTVTNKVSYAKFGLTYMRGGQALPRGYSLIPAEIDSGFIAEKQPFLYNFGSVNINIKVTEIADSAAVIDLRFRRRDEIHNYDRMRVGLEDLALMNAIFNTWMRCSRIPPILSYKHTWFYECTQPTTLFQILGDTIRMKSYHLINMQNSIFE